MRDVLVRRPARIPPTHARPKPVRLADPPAGGDPARIANWTYALFPLLGSAGILVFATVSGNPVYFLAGGVFVIGALGMGIAMYLQTRGRTKEQLTDNRLRYFEHLGEVRAGLRDAAEIQRRRAMEQHPEPLQLIGLVDRPDRLWERRPDDSDHLLIRIGRGRVPNEAAPELWGTDPGSPREPACEASARRLVERLGRIPDVPVAVSLTRGVTVLAGSATTCRALARAMVAQLAVLHAPDDVRLAVCCPDPAARAEWEWAKWLPHARNPAGGGHDGTGLMLAEDAAGLLALLDAELERRRRSAQAPGTDRSAAAAAGPALVVVVDGVVPTPDPLAELDALDVTVIRIVPDLDARPPRVDLTLLADADGRIDIEVRRDRDGDPVVDVGEVAAAREVRADSLSTAEAAVLARKLAPLQLSRRAGRTSLAEVSGLPELLGVTDVESLDVGRTWRARSEADLLRVPLGVDGDGRPVELDLKESALSGMGPHGLVVGATGSGKSELLRTLVSGLAVTHAPDELAFVLVDFKGGATFAGMSALPHVVGSITDLEDDPDSIERFAVALRSELRRREEILRDSGDLASIREHRRRRLAGGDVPPMPHLLVVVDEFSELLVQQPEFIDLFVTIGRLGRSLGVHLLLATQRLEEGRLRGLDSHLSYRLALRTFSAAESRTVIGNSDAFELPPVPGSAYLKVDTSVYRRMRVSTVSSPYVGPTERRREAPQAQPRPFLGFDRRGDLERADEGGPALPALGIDLSDPERRSTLDVIVDRLREAAEPAHQVWLAPLPTRLALGQLTGEPVYDPDRGLAVAPEAASAASLPDPGRSPLQVLLGLVDRPERQAQTGLVLDLSGTGGHVGIAGAPQTGKSTALRTLALALAVTHTPAQVQLYGLDLGGGTLASLEALPHVGGIAGRQQPERVQRLVSQLEALLEDRERWFAAHGVDSVTAFRRGRAAGTLPDDGYGDVVLLVDGWMALRQEFEELESRITTLAGRGLGYGLHVVVTVARWWDMRPAIRDSLATKIEFTLGDAADSAVDRRAARSLPALPGRAVVPGGHKAQIAEPALLVSGRPETIAETGRRLAASWTGPVAPPIRMLPLTVRLDELVPAPGAAREPGVPIGVRETDLRPARIDLFDGRDPHLLVFGDAASGRTATLRTLLTSLCAAHSPADVRVIVVDYRRTLLDVVGPEHLSLYCGSAPSAERTIAGLAEKMTERLPGPEVTVAQLRARDWWSGARIVVVVDDYELVATPSGDPLAPLLELLPQGQDIGLHVVVARSTSGAGAATLQPVLRRLRELGTPGLLLSGPRDEGPLVHGVRPAPLPVGRAQHVTRAHGAQLVQLAWTPEPDGG